MRKSFDFLGAIIAAVPGAGINPSASNKSGRKFFTSQRGTTKVYCESSLCKYRDWDLIAERRKASAEWNARRADPNIELTKRGLIKKPAIKAPI